MDDGGQGKPGPMRIGVDARPLTGRITGIGRYVHELCHALDARLPEAEFYAYAPYPLSLALPSARWRVRRPERVPAHLGGYFWFKFLSRALIEPDALDWFLATRTLLPPLSPRTRSIALVHDLNHVLAPATMNHVNRLAHALWFRRDVLRASHVVVNSPGTASRLERFCGRPADIVVRPGVSSAFVPATPPSLAAVRSKHGLTRPYLLSVATLEPRKNISALVDAFTTLQAAGHLVGWDLVLAGTVGWRQGGLARRLREGVPNVRSLGYVEDGDLPALYSGAEAFVFPSLYEGFGIPVAEALACGTRVVATDIPELRDAAQGHATLVAPDATAIAAGILDALDRPRPAATRRDEEGSALAALIRNASSNASPSRRREGTR